MSRTETWEGIVYECRTLRNDVSPHFIVDQRPGNSHAEKKNALLTECTRRSTNIHLVNKENVIKSG